MPAESSMHFYLNWAKERIDEMDAALASLEGKAAKLQADSRVNADRLIADLRKRRDEFQSAVKRQAEASDTAWESIKVQLETEWKKFEAEVKKYLEIVAPTGARQAWMVKTLRTSRGMGCDDGLANWRLRLGRRLTNRTPSEECSYRRPMANSGRWASRPCVIGSA